MNSATKDVDSLPLSHEKAKATVETCLDTYFSERLAAAKTIDPSYVRLWNSIHNLYTSGGKRLRPYITMLGYQAYTDGKDVAAIAPAAAAQELLHLAMLIHDDIIDRDLIRYGTPNVAGQYEVAYAEMITQPSERSHFSESAAILAGDLLLSDAYGLMTQCDVDPMLIISAQRILNNAVYTVVGGELLDTESAFTSHEFLRPLDIARLKTASYSFVSPLVTGATFAGAPDEEITLLRQYSEYVGIAYQLQDDLLGVFGNSIETGKSVKSDLSEAKYTYMVQVFYDKASSEQAVRFNEVFGARDVTDEALEAAKQLLIESGAKEIIAAYIDELCSKAAAIEKTLAIEPQYKAELSNIVGSLKDRRK